MNRLSCAVAMTLMLATGSAVNAGDLWLGIRGGPSIPDLSGGGNEISQGLSATLKAMGANVSHLEGGISEWQAQGHAVAPVQKEPMAP